MPSWLRRVRTIFRRPAMERELDAELQFHLDMQAAEYVRQGLSPDVARRHARRLFGGCRRHQGSRPRRLADAAARNLRAGRPLRPPRFAHAARLRPRRRRHHGARHRRQHRHLQRRQRRRAGTAALCARRGSPARASDAHRRRQHRLLHPRPRRHQPAHDVARRPGRVPQHVLHPPRAASNPSGWPPASCRGTTSRRSASRPSSGAPSGPKTTATTPRPRSS